MSTTTTTTVISVPTTDTTNTTTATNETSQNDAQKQIVKETEAAAAAAEDLLVVCLVGGQEEEHQLAKNELSATAAQALGTGNCRGAGSAESGSAPSNDSESSLHEALSASNGKSGSSDGAENSTDMQQQFSKKQCMEANSSNSSNGTSSSSAHKINSYNESNNKRSDFYASSGSQTKWYLNTTDMEDNKIVQHVDDAAGAPALPCTNPIQQGEGEATNATTSAATAAAAAAVTTTTLCANNALIIATAMATTTATATAKATSAAMTTSLVINGNGLNDGTCTGIAVGVGGDGQDSSGLSKSSIFPLTTTTTTTTTNNGISVIGIRNGYPTNLTQQMRAVSSPSLTEVVHHQQQQDGPEQPASTQQQQPSATIVTTTTNDVTVIPTNTNNNKSQTNIGVLQKFKRTLTNFNKNQLQITSTYASTSSQQQQQQQQQKRQQQQQQEMPQNATGTINGKQSPTMPTVMVIAASTTPKATTTTAATNESNCIDAASNGCNVVTVGAVGGDANSGKYRFGPLIWRSSKERRKTKFNRRDKCNSGDSGIQIELENDEQYARALETGATTSASASALSGSNNADKLRAIRRTNSAKASSIVEQSTNATSSSSGGSNTGNTSPNAKANALQKMASQERVAPESLPTRSLSQLNGLETYGIGRGSELEDSDSDSVASHEDSATYYPIYAEVLYNFTAAGPQELGLERGILIEILRKEVGPWWFGRIKKEDASLVEEILDPELGWFPKDFVRVIQCPETDAFFLSQMPRKHVANVMPVPATEFERSARHEDDGDVVQVDHSNITTIVIESPPSILNTSIDAIPSQPLLSSRVNVMLDNADLLRRSAIRELLETEVNYVKLLSAICEGYLPAMSKRIDIFSPNSVRLIFSNIAAIYKFQKKFLDALRKGIEQNQIAKVFLKMHKGFLCYSTYCNAYPRALIELETYDRSKDARSILENCRETENLAELPLSAHLLAPVQRICRYPLHLAEVMKTAAKLEVDGDCCNPNDTKTDTPDYEQLDVSQLDIADTQATVNLALEAMRSMTEAVNEGKRHSETIARHQTSFQAFKGPPLHLHSTRFFLQIDATRQKQNLWNSSYTLFLFDNQLVYCKRDIIKRNHFVYKGRIFLDRCRVVNVRDGKMFGHTIKNSLRIYCESRDKWYDFSFRSANRKHRFLNTLALERQFGGKALYVSEMTGFEYNYEERDYSDQSDYELNGENEHSLPVNGLRVRDACETSASGDSSVPESPAKSSYRNCDTLPKKSQSRDGIAGGAPSADAQTGSLGRRRLGNWFRKPKSTNCTPSQSPTHKPVAFDGDITLTAAVAVELEALEQSAAVLATEVSSA